MVVVGFEDLFLVMESEAAGEKLRRLFRETCRCCRKFCACKCVVCGYFFVFIFLLFSSRLRTLLHVFDKNVRVVNNFVNQSQKCFDDIKLSSITKGE